MPAELGGAMSVEGCTSGMNRSGSRKETLKIEIGCVEPKDVG